jgi:hypothetical protein
MVTLPSQNPTSFSRGRGSIAIVIIGSIWFIITESVRLLLLEITRIRVSINRMEVIIANLLDEDKLTKN